jgi:hypothetical protein
VELLTLAQNDNQKALRDGGLFRWDQKTGYQL